MQVKGVLLESVIRGKYVEPQGNIQGKQGDRGRVQIPSYKIHVTLRELTLHSDSPCCIFTVDVFTRL
jgi:hypothetical protein